MSSICINILRILFTTRSFPIFITEKAIKMLGHYFPLIFASIASTTYLGLFKQELSHLNAFDTCNCNGTNNTGSSGASYICNDPRLGPTLLPKTFPLLSFVSDYDRFGGQTPGDFLKDWTDEDGYYVYPSQNGFQLNDAGQPILGNMTLQNGTKVDRFGSEYGTYVSAADAPYSQRALPPNNLDVPAGSSEYPYNYHIYTVTTSFEVEGGPIAPWFGQPGLGAQFYVGATGNILTLLQEGYLERVNVSSLVPGAGEGGDCGL